MRAVAESVRGDAGPTPEDASHRAEVAAAVAEAIGDLPAAQREILVLRHYHQVPLADAAAVLGMPATTARSRLNQAMTRLRERLERHHAYLCLEGDDS